MNPRLWLTKGGLFLRPRALWAAVFAIVALFLRCSTPSPPERTAEGVAAMLGAAVGGEVRPDDFVWEARGGFFLDAFLGRRVLFLARRPGAGPSDLYRARVRLTRAGRPVSLRLVRNLTRSPLGDDRDLVAQGHHAAFVTTAFGAVQGVTLLDLDGEGEAREARTLTERAAAAVDSWLDTGNSQGIGRTEVTFGAPPAEAREELQGDLLVLALGKEAVPAAVDLRDGTLNAGPQNTFAATAQRIPHRARALADVTVDAARELVGQGAAGALRAVFGAFTPRARAAPRAPPTFAAAGGAPLAAPAGDWPPPRIESPVRPALESEGVWTAGRVQQGEAPPCFYETAIRADPAHPEAVVRLVAIDTRQVDLRLEPGVDEPRSPVGIHGTGRAPAGVPAERIVAAFAGGPASRAHDGEPGFVVDRRIFVPPSPGVATIAVAPDGKVAMGPWPFRSEVPAAFVSLRQTADALVGWTGPQQRPLPAAGEPAERSALGLLRSGQLVYAWGSGVGAESLGRALSLAGCVQAVPLASGPAPVGFAYLRAGEAEPAAPGMSLGRAELARPLANDAFYAVLRTVGPPVSSLTGWVPDPGRQPSPAWLPAIHSAVVVSLGAQVHVTTFAPGRVSFRLRAGAREPATKAVVALPNAIPEGEKASLVAAISLGVGKKRGARGLVVDGAVGLPFRSEDTGALVVEGGRARVLRAAEFTLSKGVDATELPLAAEDGKLRAEARDVGSMRARAVACALEDGTFAVAATTFDSDEAATNTLLDLGCTRVVALDRGIHHAAFMHRAGTETPPETRYDASALYAVEVPLTGRAGPLGP
jgi:hypothetical protein